MEDQVQPRYRALTAATIALIVLFAVALQVRFVGAFALRAFDDVGQSAGAALGAAGCMWRSRRSSGRWRTSWWMFAGGCAAWSIGELIWSYYEIIAKRDTPFPSFADLGFMFFPVLCLVGMLVRPSAVFAGRGRGRVVLDGVMVTASLFNLTWMTALGQVFRAGGTPFNFAVSIAYPIGDLILVTVAMIVLAHARARAGLLLLLAGLVMMALADSSFVYFVAVGIDPTGQLDDIGWFAAFVLIGLAAVRSNMVGESRMPKVESTRFLVVPYACVGIAGVAEAILIARGKADVVTLFVAAAAIVALLLRQLLMVLDNRSLVLDVMSQQAELRHLAFHDSLTGLANRALFHDRVTHALELRERDLRPVSLLYCDLDGFKTVNDSLGHDAGDAMLTAVARRLESLTRPGDTLARLGGDEFAILLEDGGDVEALSERLLDAFAGPVSVGNRSVPIRASIGTATLGAGDAVTSADELVKRADLAMYAAKRSGRGTPIPFTTALLDSGVDDLDERLALAEAVRDGTVRTAFQPIERVDGEPYAFEALARWRHQGVDVSPARFIPLAERAGVLGDLDLLMTRMALGQLSELDALGGPPVSMSVNLGASVLHRPDLPQRIAMLLEERGIDPHRLVVEVSETDALGDPRTGGALSALRAVGMRIAIDDFGVGYSNFSRLGDLAPDVVKLDMSLVRPLDDPGSSPRLVSAVVQLAHDLGAFVVGEGVETERALTTLRELSCDAVQGFHIGRPDFALSFSRNREMLSFKRGPGSLLLGGGHSVTSELQPVLLADDDKTPTS